MARRWSLARNLMGLLLFGNSGVNRHNQANVFWLTNQLDLHHNYLPPEGRHFEKNMVIVIQPNPITPDERMGLQLGALTLVTDQGAECLHQVPFEPIIVEL